MTVESSARFISELNEAYPRTQDLINEGDDHIRLVKSVLQSTFPAYDRAVTMTAEKFNTLDTVLLYDTETGILDLNAGVRFKGPGYIDANFNRINNVLDPIDPGDAVPLSYFQAGTFNSWPIGSIYMTADARNPAEIFGFGTWEVFAEGRMIIGSTAGETDINEEFRVFVNGEEGGEYSHTITEVELPIHSHPVIWPVDEAGNTIPDGDHTHDVDLRVHDYAVTDPANTWVAPSGDIAGEDQRFTSVVGARTKAGSGSHVHEGVTAGPTGGGLAGNNISPYIVVNIWIRVADPVEPPPEEVSRRMARMNRR